MQEEHGIVRQERDALLTNISSLYNTAKLEIGRKDGEIKDLRARSVSLLREGERITSSLQALATERVFMRFPGSRGRKREDAAQNRRPVPARGTE